MPEISDESQHQVAAADALSILLENHRAFLRYLERRVGDRAIAEDILQDAFVRNLGRLEALPDEALVPWFYRTLRNATIDHYRRRSNASQALEACKELETAEVPWANLHEEICRCVSRLAETLKPEYAEALPALPADSRDRGRWSRPRDAGRRG